MSISAEVLIHSSMDADQTFKSLRTCLHYAFAFSKAEVSFVACFASGADNALFIEDVNLYNESVQASLGLCIIFVNERLFLVVSQPYPRLSKLLK